MMDPLDAIKKILSSPEGEEEKTLDEKISSLALQVETVSFDAIQTKLDVAREKLDCAWYEKFYSKVKVISFATCHALLLPLTIAALACFVIAVGPAVPFASAALFISLFFGYLFPGVAFVMLSIFTCGGKLYSIDKPEPDKIETHQQEIQELEQIMAGKEAKENILLAARGMYQEQEVPPEIVRCLIATAWLKELTD